MKYLHCLFVLLVSAACIAQNPVSFPKDSMVSKPELNFEVLWHTFEDNYAFFKLRHIDWHTTYQVYRPQVNATTSDDSLYTVFSKMLFPFQDNHINVIIPGAKQFKSVKPSQFVKEFSSDSLRAAFWKMVDYTLYKKNFSSIKFIGPTAYGKPLFAFTVSNNVGYLRFNRCFVDGDADSKPDAAVAGKILDTVFSHFKNVGSLVVDVRDNIGGNDEFSYEVAARFARRKIIGMYKKTRQRGGGYEDFGNAEKWLLEPKGKYQFFKPVVLLTNDKTVSAGDVFAMIMKALPQVRIVGSNSRGIYSDMYGFTLPNGWMISLSNQRYYNNKMQCYEGSGTPANIRVLNTRQDLKKKNDPVLERALKKLLQK